MTDQVDEVDARPWIERWGVRWLPAGLREQAAAPNPVLRQLMPRLVRRTAWLLYAPWIVSIVMSAISTAAMLTPAGVGVALVLTPFQFLVSLVTPMAAVGALQLTLSEMRAKGVWGELLASGVSGRQVVQGVAIPFLARSLGCAAIYVVVACVLASVSTILDTSQSGFGFGAVGEWMFKALMICLIALMSVVGYMVYSFLVVHVVIRVACVLIVIPSGEVRDRRMWSDVYLTALGWSALYNFCCLIGYLVVLISLRPRWNTAHLVLDWLGDRRETWAEMAEGDALDIPVEWPKFGKH